MLSFRRDTETINLSRICWR